MDGGETNYASRHNIVNLYRSMPSRECPSGQDSSRRARQSEGYFHNWLRRGVGLIVIAIIVTSRMSCLDYRLWILETENVDFIALIGNASLPV